MDANPALASWLVAQRLPIERRMRAAMGPAAPRASGGEAETLRRFRSYTGVALHRGTPSPPALDGLQVNERRMAALLDAWLGAAVALSGPDAEDVERALTPLVTAFRQALRQSGSSRTAKGRPRTSRRAVAAAIDRIADGFVAIDTVEGSITDANPAAGALLGTPRDTLLGVEFAAFVPNEARGVWQARLDAMAEGGDHARFESALCDVTGERIGVSVSLTAYPTKGRTLALAVCRPVSNGAAHAGAPGHRSSVAAHRAESIAHTVNALEERGALRDPVESAPQAPVDEPRAGSTASATPSPPPDSTANVGFARLSDGKPIPRRSDNQLRRGPRATRDPGSRDAGRRRPAAATTRPPPPSPETPPAGSRS